MEEFVESARSFQKIQPGLAYNEKLFLKNLI